MEYEFHDHYFGTKFNKELQGIIELRKRKETRDQAFQELEKLAEDGEPNAQLYIIYKIN